MATPLYLLSGPTASGKSGLAHQLADRLGMRLLSADSMMVYRGMDIGTAKPTPEEIRRYDYAGLNLVDPGERFSTGAWLERVGEQLDGRPTLAVGGTGLYFQALVYGLEEGPRGESEEEGSAKELRESIREINPEVLDRLADPWNPRRLERALHWLQSGKTLPENWASKPPLTLPVLRRPTLELNHRIEQRVHLMLQQGLEEECQRLRDSGSLTGTAAQAIGYEEGIAVLEGRMTPEEAVSRIATRTRRYAKRQRTWFRNRMDARWVDLEANRDENDALRQIESIWQETGPVMWETSV